jgi:hypothetical protein
MMPLRRDKFGCTSGQAPQSSHPHGAVQGHCHIVTRDDFPADGTGRHTNSERFNTVNVEAVPSLIRAP